MSENFKTLDSWDNTEKELKKKDVSENKQQRRIHQKDAESLWYEAASDLGWQMGPLDWHSICLVGPHDQRLLFDQISVHERKPWYPQTIED